MTPHVYRTDDLGETWTALQFSVDDPHYYTYQFENQGDFTFVDRTFDRDRAAYRRAVREISEAMVSMLSIKEVVDRILVALTDTMGVDRAVVLLLDEERRVQGALNMHDLLRAGVV